MIGLALVWLSQVPFRLAEVWWERRYDQTDSGYVESLFANWIALGAEFLFVSFALVVVMAIAGVAPRRWWLFAAPFFVGLAALFGFVYPYLSVTEPLEDAALSADARAYAEKQGIEPVRIAVEDVTDFTSSPNAYAVGFGPTKRIVFWNTLLDDPLIGDDEVRVVLAHELAHHSRSHIPKALGWYALFALPGAWLIAVATRRRGGMADPPRSRSLARPRPPEPALDPGLQPRLRHMEEEADWVALETTRSDGGRRSSRRSPSSRSTTPTRPPGRTCSSTATRRSSSGSSSPTRGVTGPRRSPRPGATAPARVFARRPIRFRGSGVLHRSACIPGRSRPRAGWDGRPSR